MNTTWSSPDCKCICRTYLILWFFSEMSEALRYILKTVGIIFFNATNNCLRKNLENLQNHARLLAHSYNLFLRLCIENVLLTLLVCHSNTPTFLGSVFLNFYHGSFALQSSKITFMIPNYLMAYFQKLRKFLAILQKTYSWLNCL